MPFGVPDFHALHIEQGVEYFFRNDFHTAVVEFDQALQIRESPMARFDRALTLLSLGRYSEGWADYAARYQLRGDGLALTSAGRSIRRRAPQWRGEPASVIVLAEDGFGDTIMLMRFLPLINHPSSVDVPRALRRLTGAGDVLVGECWCSFFDLPGLFDPVIPEPPYLFPDPELVAGWRSKIANGDERRIGIVWSSNTHHRGEHVNQTRSMELEQFLALLPFEGALFSLQAHDRQRAAWLGVNTPKLKDFADVAALASLMDVVVSVDTAALHVAGAIGHPRVYAILPWAHTWRWRDARWYPQMKLCKAEAPGDWASAFNMVKCWP